MALISTPEDKPVDTSGELLEAYNADRKRIIIQNRDASVTGRLYKLPGKNDIAPSDLNADYIEIGPGEAWTEEGYRTASNPLFIASSSGTITLYTELT